MKNKEEIYQINNDYVSIIHESQNQAKKIICNDKVATQEEVQSFIEQLDPLKKLSNSSPKSFKNLTIKVKKNNIKKTIR